MLDREDRRLDMGVKGDVSLARGPLTVPFGFLCTLLWVSHTPAELITGSEGWRGWRKATVGKGTDGMWVTAESDRELSTPPWLPDEGTLHRGNGEGDASPPEEPGMLRALRDCSGVEEDLGRRCRMEEKKEQDSGRGMVPIPLSNVRTVQPRPAAQGEQLKWIGEEEGERRAAVEAATFKHLSCSSASTHGLHFTSSETFH